MICKIQTVKINGGNHDVLLSSYYKNDLRTNIGENACRVPLRWTQQRVRDVPDNLIYGYTDK